MSQTNRIILKDPQSNFEWFYFVDSPELLDALRTAGQLSADGIVVLTQQNLLLLKLDVERVLTAADRYVKNLNVPEFKEPIVKDEHDISSFVNCTNDDLERLLLVFGGYRAYLDAQIAYVEAKKVFYESTFDDELAKFQQSLLDDNGQQKRPRKTKELVRGEGLARNPHLSELKRKLNNLNIVYVRLIGLRNAYKSAYDAVSRVVALRLSSKEQV